MIKTKWYLKHVFNAKDEKKLRAKYTKLTNKFVKNWRNNTSYLKNSTELLKALTEFEIWVDIFGGFGDEMLYRWLESSLKQNDPKVKAKYNKAYEFVIEQANKMEFFRIELGKIELKKQKEFLKEKSLEKFHYFLEKVFEASKHFLNEKEEQILNLKSKTSRENWVSMLQDLISKQEREILDENGKKSKKNFNEILDLINHKNKKIRDVAAKSLNEIFEKYIEVAEHEINSVLEDKKVNDSLRKFENADDSRILSDEVDKKSVYALVEAVTNRFDISKRFYKLKAKALGLKKLAYHERNLEVGVEVDKKYSFKEAYKIVEETFRDLDSEFSTIYKSAFEKGLVDVEPKKGKYSGAFCSPGMKHSPTFVLLNFTRSLRDISVIAHEFGHAIHFEMSKKNQLAIYCDVPMSTAEVASTFFEDFTFSRIETELAESEKFSLEMSRLNDTVSTVFRQVAFYNFELELHKTYREKGYLSFKEIGKIFQKHMKSYMGDYVEQSEGSENWWIYISHFRSMFYVYSYAFGLLISKAMQKKVKADSSKISDVKYFLSSGSSKSPEAIFKNIGIDITSKKVWMDGISEIESQLVKLENAISSGK